MFTSSQVQQGMKVVGTNGDTVGQVKEVRSNDFLVNRNMQRDVYMPFSAVQNVSGNTIALNIPANQVDNMGWANPSMT